ncbi:MAG: polyprenyl synthetase family protein [Ruminococcaceae bacterium]|nr:polyprenyl synthetase family protein [Oscillospiraceae bacterium]
MTDIKQILAADAELVNDVLRGYFARNDEDIKELLESERYSLFAGGKRIRPFLTLEFCKLFGGKAEAALPFGCALEMIHTYSLIHDDLPCMDDDDLRRGKPTNHKVFGYSTALLAGDALLTHAFGVAASNDLVESNAVAQAVKLLSEQAGEFGMVGGQIIDLAGESEKLSLDKLIKLHSMKTGALIRAACLMGVIAAGYPIDSEEAVSAAEYAEKIGLAFQIIDDILDATATEEELGKSVGSDAESNKTTFLSYYSAEEAYAYAGTLTAEAVSAISSYEGSEVLTDFAVYLLDRKS